MRQRLAESFEAALRIADGRAIALEMDATSWRAGPAAAPSTASAAASAARCAATRCPSSSRGCFRFNSPVGACPSCDGLGQVTAFDPERVVAFPQLSLAGGAIKGWDRRNAYSFSMLESVARHCGFDIETPFEELPARGPRRCCCTARATRRSSSSTAPNRSARAAAVAQREARHPFEGIIPNFERRYRETDSAAVREDLARYQAAQPCPDCARQPAAARGAPCVPAADSRARAPPSPARRSSRSSTGRWRDALA